jgi:very-short-patch-repair endonuclease
MGKKNKIRNILIARSLRKSLTPVEALLWKYLKDRHMIHIKFRRQYPVAGFVLDFYCPAKKLGIELDGSIHNIRKEYDVARQDIIEDKGIKILRFRNEEVVDNMEGVLRKIKRSISPSLRSGEGCPKDRVRA